MIRPPEAGRQDPSCTRLTAVAEPSGPEQEHAIARIHDHTDRGSAGAREMFPRLEEIGYDGAFSFEAKHDPFLPIAVAAEHTTTIQLGTAIAIAFARNPMNLANLGNDLQLLTDGRFLLGLGSQIRPHIVNRFSSVWSEPAKRMREIVLAMREIWRCWETGDRLRFEGDFYRHTLMIPTFDPGPNPFGPPPVYIGGLRRAHGRRSPARSPTASSPIRSRLVSRSSSRRCRPSTAASHAAGRRAPSST